MEWGALAELAVMQFSGEREGTVEARAERRLLSRRTRRVADPAEVKSHIAELACTHYGPLIHLGAVELGESGEVLEPRVVGLNEWASMTALCAPNRRASMTAEAVRCRSW